MDLCPPPFDRGNPGQFSNGLIETTDQPDDGKRRNPNDEELSPRITRMDAKIQLRENHSR
jgi:hypothetical protein